MKNGGVWRRLAGSLSGTSQIYLCGAVSGFRIPGSIVYTVYQDENACGVVDASKKLTEAKKILKQQLKN